MTLECKTKYPIFFVHGTGSRDRKKSSCWGRIPKALEEQGAKVYFGGQDALGSIEENAKAIKDSINACLPDNEKVNIIALSKGGLEARYMIHKLGMEDRVASLTTVSTPHYGSKSMDVLCKFLKHPLKLIAFFVNIVYRLQGDVKPNFNCVCCQLTTSALLCFNEEVLDSKQVYYQSYASVMKKSYSDMLLFVPHLFVKFFEGECDGIVSVDSAKWGEFKGVITGDGIRGMSHADLRDIRKRDGVGTDIRRVYVDIVKDLKARGF